MIRQRDIRKTSNLQIDGYGGREERHCTTILELTGEQDDRVAAPARSLPWLVFAASDEGQPLGRHSHDPIARPAPVSPFIGSFSLSLSPSSWSSPLRVHPLRTSSHHSTPQAPGGGGRRGIRHRNEAALRATRPKHAARALRSGEPPPRSPFHFLQLSHYLIHVLAAASMSMSIYRLGIWFYFMGIGMITGIPPNCFARDVLRSISR
jgi:hypothetical protein